MTRAPTVLLRRGVGDITGRRDIRRNASVCCCCCCFFFREGRFFKRRKKMPFTITLRRQRPTRKPFTIPGSRRPEHGRVCTKHILHLRRRRRRRRHRVWSSGRARGGNKILRYDLDVSPSARQQRRIMYVYIVPLHTQCTPIHIVHVKY